MENFNKNLIILFKIFNKRPNHLAKFLTENDAFTDEFKKTINNSDKLNDLNDFDYSKMDFSDFGEMNEFFSNLIKSDKFEISNKLNNQLFELIINEEYEEAARLRDYMIKNDLKIEI
jgi:transcriptional accessory protein Tex/SPT6